MSFFKRLMAVLTGEFPQKKNVKPPEPVSLPPAPPIVTAGEMRLSRSGADFIKLQEGLRLKPYQCSAGVWTIGYGHTNGVYQNHPSITLTEAHRLFCEDVAVFEKGVNNLVRLQITQHQFDALVSFAYNLGLNNLRRSTLLRLLNEGETEKAAKEFRKWNKAGGKVLRGLTNRRKAEEQIFLHGIYKL